MLCRSLGGCWMSKYLFTDCVQIVGNNVSPFQGEKIYVSTGALDGDHIDFSQTENVTYSNKPSRANLSAESGNILFAKMQGTKKTLVIDDESEKYIYSTGFFAIKPNSHVITERCLFHLLQSELFHSQKDKYCSGATQKAITNAGLSKITLKIPDLTIQPNLSQNLDNIEITIRLCNTILDKLDLLVKARFVEMFGDIYTNNHNYVICYLADFIDFLTSGSRGWAQYCVDDGSEWFITIKNVKDCRITTDNIQPVNAPDNMEAKRTKVKEGDLLISITADLGRTGVVTKEIAEHGAYINQHLTCIRLDQSKINPLFVAYFMESASGKPQFEAKNQTGVKAGLNFDSIKTLKLLVPPLELQNQFAAFVEKTDRTKAAVQQVLAKAETLKKALMQEYFG